MFNRLFDVFPVFDAIMGITPAQVRDVLVSKCLLKRDFLPYATHEYFML